jgi:hypothetical protein
MKAVARNYGNLSLPDAPLNLTVCTGEPRIWLGEIQPILSA